MKKSIYIIFPLILIFSSISSQNNPLSVSKIETAWYKVNQDGSEELSYEILETFEYDENGNLIVEEQIKYNDQGEIYSQVAYKNEYDVFGKKIKSILQHYKPNVDLWITQNHFDYSYDDNDCRIGEVQSGNLMVDLERKEKKYVNDIYCRKIEEENKNYSSTGSLTSQENINIEYLNDRISFLKRQLTVFLDNCLPDPVEECTFNSYGDLLSYLNYGVVPDTTIFDDHYFIYDYNFSDDGLLMSKDQKRFKNRIFSNNTIDTFLISTRHSSYEYDCQGNIVKEVHDSLKYNAHNVAYNIKKKYVSYYYSGESKCFDHKANLKMKIFPNPTSDFIKISSPIFGSGDTNVRIIDLTGRIIYDQLVTSREPIFTLDFKNFNLPTGIFIVQLQSDKYQVGKKILFLE